MRSPKASCRFFTEAYHTFLSGGGEVFFHIHLAYSFAQHAAGDRNGTFPTGLHFLCPAHGAAIEVKVLLHNVIAQERGQRGQ